MDGAYIPAQHHQQHKEQKLLESRNVAPKNHEEGSSPGTDLLMVGISACAAKYKCHDCDLLQDCGPGTFMNCLEAQLRAVANDCLL